MVKFVLISLLLIQGFVSVPACMAEKTPATQMRQLIKVWPPNGWHVTAPGSRTPYPPYITDGEFSGTIYRQTSQNKLWSAHVSITDQQTSILAKQMLKNYSHCEEISFNNNPGRACTSMGESLGRQSLIYAKEQYLIEISVIGPLPLELPVLVLQAPRHQIDSAD